MYIQWICNFAMYLQDEKDQRMMIKFWGMPYLIKTFIIPEKKYYLADARYHNTNYLSCLYRGNRYHLKEQAMAGQRPANKEELFNLCHSSLRNVC